MAEAEPTIEITRRLAVDVLGALEAALPLVPTELPTISIEILDAIDALVDALWPTDPGDDG